MLAFCIISVTNSLICSLLFPLAYLSYLYMKNLKNYIMPCCSFLCRCGKIFVCKIVSACLEVFLFFSTNAPILYFIGIILEDDILALIKLFFKKV